MYSVPGTAVRTSVTVRDYHNQNFTAVSNRSYAVFIQSVIYSIVQEEILNELLWPATHV